MTILKDVFSELFSMFVSDAWLTAAVLALVALVALLVDGLHAEAMIGGGVLLFGSLALVYGSVRHAARRSSTSSRRKQ
jgi:predicted lysophospholipase L1 biosynthesis ABC-type transport system permease subunit